MGLFSKKDYVCEKCGKTFQKRVNLNGNLCDECLSKEFNEKAQLEEQIRGYIRYGREVLSKNYSADEMRQIIERKTGILDKYKNEVGISKAELQNASDNYKKLSDDQAADVLLRVASSSVSATMGAAYSGSFFVPTNYEGMIVDANDVFAVGYTSDYKVSDVSSEAILCAVFTNDPYVPVFPMVYVGKIGFFALTKSKKGREGVSAMFESMCPNLAYPVGDLKQLKKTIKQDGDVKGNVDMKFMLDQISNASFGSELFDTKKMYSELHYASAEMLDKIGYIEQTEVAKILKMDKMFNRNYWNKQMARISK